jgi:hypothetical protein
LYASGTAASNSTIDENGNGVLKASGSPGWSTNQFAGMMLQNTDQVTGSGPAPCVIISNTSNTITFSPDDLGYGGGNSPTKKFASGEHFAIYQVLTALDQIGYGQCQDRIGGSPVVNMTTGDLRWPHQALEPVYCFENYANGTLSGASSTFPTVKENREYYNQTNSFDGNTGVGVGTLAHRPSTCTKGVAYWVTDQGEWDSTHDGPDGQLYVCTATNSWTAYYTPYIYPHPLVSGDPVPPEAPQNLRIK